MDMSNSCLTKYFSEAIGTFLLVFIGCGVAIFTGAQVGFLGVSLAFGITLMVLVYCLGNISGCHLNPAVTLALAFANRFPLKDVFSYIVSQLIGALLAGGVLYFMISGAPNLDAATCLPLNGFGEHSPTGCSMITCFWTEFISTGILILTVLLATRKSETTGFAGVAIGGILTVLIAFNIPITNASLNFARSLGTAVLNGGWAIQQLWLFALADFAAAFVLAFVVKKFLPEPK